MSDGRWKYIENKTNKSFKLIQEKDKKKNEFRNVWILKKNLTLWNQEFQERRIRIVKVLIAVLKLFKKNKMSRRFRRSSLEGLHKDYLRIKITGGMQGETVKCQVYFLSLKLSVLFVITVGYTRKSAWTNLTGYQIFPENVHESHR
jgi:hypothetical protein